MTERSENRAVQTVDGIEEEIREHTDSTHPRLLARLMWLVGWWKRNVKGETGLNYSLEGVEPPEPEPTEEPFYISLARVFGLIIVAGESVYFLMVLLPIWYNPAFEPVHLLFAVVGLAHLYIVKRWEARNG